MSGKTDWSKKIQHQCSDCSGTIAFRKSMTQWIVSRPAVSRVVNGLGISEVRRRLIHMAPALVIIGLPLLPHYVGMMLILPGTVVLTVAFIAFAFIYAPQFRRRGETNWVSAVSGYAIPIVVPLLLFPNRPEFGLLTLEIVAIGDGSATLGGKLFGGERLPWNRRKTWTGLACFVICGALAATYMYWGMIPGCALHTAFVVCFVASLCAGIVESLPLPTNDNLRVGTTACLAGLVMSSLLLSL